MRAVGIILAGGNNEGRLGTLTQKRAAAALPVGSCYRAIDFALSNMSNSGISKVAVLTQYNSRSLRDHLSSSKWWDFGRKQGGLFVLTPYTTNEGSSWFRGTADAIYQNMSYLYNSNEPYVVIASGDAVYKGDFRKVIAYHVEKGADITVVYKNMENNLSSYGILEMDEDHRLVGFEEKPEHPRAHAASIGIYVIGRQLLIDLLQKMVPNGKYSLVKDIIIGMRDELKIYGYECTGYWSTVGRGIDAYFATNMDFLKKEVRDEFINQWPYIATKPKDEPPAKYNAGASVSDSIIGSGSIINGTINHSVVFRKVYISEDAVVENSILMEGCRIGKGCVIRNAILDKYVKVLDGKSVIGESSQNPVVIEKEATID